MQSIRLLLGLWILGSWPGLQCAPSGKRQGQLLSAQLSPHYLQAMNAYRRLQHSVPTKELRALTTIGLLNGAREAEHQMEQHLVLVIKELLQQTDESSGANMLPKIEQIEHQLVRDQRALDILSSAMDLVTHAKDERTFRVEMREALQRVQQEELLAQQQSANVTELPELGERLAKLRRHILKQVPQMKTQLYAKIEHTLEHLLDEATADGLLAKASNKVLHKREAQQQQQQQTQIREEPSEIRMIKSILTEVTQLREQEDFRENLVIEPEHFEPRNERQAAAESKPQEQARKTDLPTADDDEFSLNIDSGNITVSRNGTAAKQEDASADAIDMEGDDAAGGGGGLVGLIGSLSGGEGGSDVGALIGALTGVISSLFGPGGLDIESLISTSTSLLAGLLSGNKNFGTVLGTYVGTALDGLSGGGGAINNGQFFGNFLGTVVASLSADPEEEGPLQPLVFIQNMLSSFLEAKNRLPEGEASEERHGSAELPARHKKKEAAAGGGSDSGSFVKQIVSHLVSSALGLILNASLGASGGASHASSGIFSSSSAASSHMKPAAAALHHHRSWT